ncbi:ABC transporter permease [Ensifer soli]|uniref:ABC transporter permease n=1 Tax=Ciceribacter sp. sgz301302 TaxID=3342379 RepID=UPI0035B821A1
MSKVSLLWETSPTSLRVGALIVFGHLLLSVLGPWLAPYAPAQMGAGIPLSGASVPHPFGLDQLGRDVFSRTLHGAWLVLTLSLSGTVLGFLVGGFLGLVSGYVGGVFDVVVNRLMEALISIPVLFTALLIVALSSAEAAGSIPVIIAVIGFVFAPRVGRIARAAAIEISSRDYVVACRLRGEPAWRVALREILPNASGTLLVEFALRAAYAPVLVASLGFLGFGIRPPTPEWGLIISENRTLLFLSPATVIGPGLLLASLVVGFNLLTEGLARIVGLQVAVKG